MKYKIPFIKPSLPSSRDLSEDYHKIINSNWFTNFGPYEEQFSAQAASFIGEGVYATTISSCTLGLDAAISILFNKQKSKVIVPSFTFASGVEVVIKNNYDPVFIDINKDDLQPSLGQAKEILEKNSANIAGILLGNTFGVGNADIEKWERLTSKYNIPLVIDSAAGFGSMYNNGERVGSRGDCEVFSIHATKPFAVGEGGIVASKNEDLIKKIRAFQNFGFGEDKNIHIIGTNAKLQEINCAIGVRQLENYEDRLSKRRNTLGKYKKLLSDRLYDFQYNDDLSTVPFATILIKEPSLADTIYDRLHSSGVEARRYYSPLHLQRILLKYRLNSDISLKNTEDIASRILSLPVHDDIKDDEVEYIAGIIKETSGK